MKEKKEGERNKNIFEKYIFIKGNSKEKRICRFRHQSSIDCFIRISLKPDLNKNRSITKQRSV